MVLLDSVRETSGSCHPKKMEKETPKISISELNLLPLISVREWMSHTSQMLLYDWFPLTYFTMAAILAPRDDIGCYDFGIERSQSLMLYVYGPLLVMRFIGLQFFNKRHLIFMQMIIIYTYLLVTLTIWEVNTLAGMKSQDPLCYKPLKMTSLNTMIMNLFYMFVLCPLYTIGLLVPYYLVHLYKNVHISRQKALMKHYLIKAMPSVIFNKKLFDEEAFMECAICMETFEGSDYVTPLYCDARHFFHSDCIENWLSKKNECPLCKKIQTP